MHNRTQMGVIVIQGVCHGAISKGRTGDRRSIAVADDPSFVAGADFQRAIADCLAAVKRTGRQRCTKKRSGAARAWLPRAGR